MLAWDRGSKYKAKCSYLELEAGKAKITRIGIPATFGGGIKKNLLALIVFQAEIYKWLYKNKNKFDVIHACDFDTAYTSFKFAHKYKKKFVYDIFDYYIDSFSVPTYLREKIKKMDHNIINAADVVIICSEQRREQIKGTFPKKLVVIHNTPQNVRNNLKKIIMKPEKTKLVYVGVLSEGRFIEELVEVVKKHKEYELHIGGFGKYEIFLENEAGKNQNIFFYGKLPYIKTLELENSCDIMPAIYNPAVKNHFYAAPNKFYEGLLLGKPLIMAKNTGMANIVSEKGYGEVIDYSFGSLENAIRNLIDKKSTWSNLSEKMKRNYVSEYSWDIMEKRLLSLYEEIL